MAASFLDRDNLCQKDHLFCRIHLWNECIYKLIKTFLCYNSLFQLIYKSNKAWMRCLISRGICKTENWLHTDKINVNTKILTEGRCQNVLSQTKGENNFFQFIKWSNQTHLLLSQLIKQRKSTNKIKTSAHLNTTHILTMQNNYPEELFTLPLLLFSDCHGRQ